MNDRLQIDGPAFLKVDLGEPEALVRPEVALGAGWSRWAHDATRGSVDHLYGGGWAGVVWDLGPRSFADLLSLGLEAGYEARDARQPSPRIAWIGGRKTPLVTVHLWLLDVGLTGGVGWDGEDLGLLVGVALGLIL